MRHGSTLLALLILLVPTFARAQAADYSDWSNDRLYQYGVRRLEEGRNYLGAIGALEEAARHQPDDLDVQTALGCACAARYASIQFARLRPKYGEQLKYLYEPRLAIWEQTHTRPGWPFYGAPPPPRPLPPYTPDDDKPFAVAGADAAKAARDLAARGLAAFRRAARLAETMKSPDQRVKAAYRRGWGLLTFRTFDIARELDETPPADNQAAPDDHRRLPRSEIADCFRDCLAHFDERRDRYRTDPDLAECKQSLAFALEASALIDLEHVSNEFDARKPLSRRDDVPGAVVAMKEAAVLKPKDARLRYQLAMMLASTQPADSGDVLETLAGDYGGNAVLWYMIATQRFRQADTQTGDEAERTRALAVRKVEAGNRAPDYASIPLAPPAPVELRHAWDHFSLFAMSSEAQPGNYIFDAIGEMGKRLRDAGDPAAVKELLHLAQVQAQYGLKLIRHYDDARLDPRDPLTLGRLRGRVLEGIVNVLRARDLVKYAAQIDDSEPVLDAVRHMDEDYQLARWWDKAVFDVK